jgi:hypothetical protein
LDVWVGDRIEVWDTVVCQQCGTVLQVVNLDPPVLDYNWHADLDDDDDDEFEYEYEDDFYAVQADEGDLSDWGGDGWEDTAYDDEA